jgi:hypothetical protein
MKDLRELKSKVNMEDKRTFTKSKYDEFYPKGQSVYDFTLDQQIRREKRVKEKKRK